MSIASGDPTAYVAAGLGGRLGAGQRPAVVVVDLSLGFTDPSCPLGADLDAVVVSSRRLLDAARTAAAPVVFTTIALAADGREGAVWRQKIPALSWLTEGSQWAQLNPRLRRMDTEPLVVKRAASAFAGTGLAALLISLAVDSVVLCGATTSGCVRATAVDACALGWPTFVVRDCVGDRDAGAHRASLMDLDAKYADVIELAQACDMVTAYRESSR